MTWHLRLDKFIVGLPQINRPMMVCPL